jgi:hypothetical protein
MNYEKCFELYKEVFLIYEDDSYYYGLTPLEIVNNFYANNNITLNFKFISMEKLKITILVNQLMMS